MINIKIEHNLNELLDQVNQLRNEIQMRTAAGQMAAVNAFQSELFQQNGGGMENAIAQTQSDGTNYIIEIDNFNQYHIYNTNEKTMQDVAEDAIQILSSYLKRALGGEF